MRIKIEPKEFFMYAVFLAFSKEHPDPEDEAIKAYLDAHELIPKAQGTDKVADQECDVMYFGGCYLGKHLEVICDMQRQAVEHQVRLPPGTVGVDEREPPASRQPLAPGHGEGHCAGSPASPGGPLAPADQRHRLTRPPARPESP